MLIHNINDFKNGWIVGDFDPSLFKSKNFECGIKYIESGYVNPSHYHSESIEINVVISGIVKFNNKIYEKNSIVIIEKNECSLFECIESCVLVVIRDNSSKFDKHEC